MTKLNATHKELLNSALVYFNNEFISKIDTALRIDFGFRPERIQKYIVDIQKIRKSINSEKEINKELLPTLKTALVKYRLSIAENVLQKSALTFNEEIRQSLDRKLSVFSDVFNEKWFDLTPLTDDFEISNFVSIQHAVDKSKYTLLKERKFDEKFHILNAPELFFDDLSYFRSQCGIRNKSVCVAYVDIDDFKAFNSKYLETRVDKEILPRFMSEIDAFLYFHGFAYRYGGDEYIITIPNMNLQESSLFLDKLQNAIRQLEFIDISDNIKVSIGLVEVNKETYLTNHEIEERAGFAKNYAKDNGKNCIAIFKSQLMNDKDLKIVASNYS